MDSRFNIVFSGELLGETRAQDAIERLISDFGLAEAKARALVLDGQSHVVKREIDAKTAERYRVALERAGLVVRIEPAAPPAVELTLIPLEDESSSEGAERILCPACGSDRLENGICLECGVVREKYLQRGEQRAESHRESRASGVDSNPYAAPRASLSTPPAEGRLTGPRSVPAGHGLSWIVRGFWHFKTRPLAWILIAIVFIALSIVVGLIPFVGGLATSILSPILIAGVMYGAREQDHAREIRIEHLFAGFSIKSGQLALVGVLYLVGAIVIAVLAGMIIGAALVPAMSGVDPQLLESRDPEAMFELMGPSVLVAVLVASLFFVPLIMATLFAPALVILDGLSATNAMKLSFSACLKNILPFLIYGLIGLVLILLGALPFGLGLLVVWPTLMAAVYVAYRDIFYG